MLYGIFGGMFVTFGVMIIVQGAIVGEKRSGTAAWVLSKPVTRTAFVVFRLVGNTLGVFVYVSPVILFVGPNDRFPGVATSLIYGESPFSWIPVISTAVLSAAFVAVAIWRINRQEF